MCFDTYYDIVYVSAIIFIITQGNYIGYMFRLLNSHFQACSLQVKSQDAVHTLGSQCVVWDIADRNKCLHSTLYFGS